MSGASDPNRSAVHCEDARFPEEYRHSRDDEISLIDLWLVLVRRRQWLFGIAVGVFLVGSVYAFLQSVEKEYTTTIQVAEESHGTPIVALENAVATLQRVVVPQVRDLFKEEFDRSLPAVETVSIEGTSLVTLESSAGLESTEIVNRFHKEIYQRLESEQKAAFDRLHGRLERRLARLDKNHKSREERLEAQIKVAESRIADKEEELQELLDERDQISEKRQQIFADNVGNEQDTGRIESLISEMQEQMSANREDRRLIQEHVRNIEENLATLISDLNEMDSEFEQRRQEIQARLEDLSPPQAMGIATVTAETGNSSQLITALSAVLGVMLGVFGAFFREFLAVAHAQGA